MSPKNKDAQKLAALRMSKMTKEQRSAIARMGGKAGGRGRPKTALQELPKERPGK